MSTSTERPTATEPLAPYVSKAEFDEAVTRLADAAAAYYDGTDLRMTDADYDRGVQRVFMTSVDHPDWETPASQAILGAVAAGQSAGGDVTHPTRMLSMDKAETLDAVDALVTRIQALPNDGQGRDGVVVEPKMDGLALRCEYREGRLVLAATRGDGSTGEDVTAQVLRGNGIDGLPAMLGTAWTGEVRGEVFMTAPQFVVAQDLRRQRGGKPFVNPRNATAGALRKSGDEHWMPLTFAAYDISSTGPLADLTSHADRMGYASRLGFTTARSLLADHDLTVGPFDHPEVVRMAIAEIERVRPDLPFDIDGAVIKADQDRGRVALGEGSRTPRWALAYKYAADEAQAQVLDIEVSVGRTGRMGLRARITPTFVGGTTVEYATMHNPQWAMDSGIGIGSTVVLKRAGDVIPRITAPLDIAANAGIPAWSPPATCPQCGEMWNTESLLWRCETPSCGLVSSLEYAFARDALDAEGIGGTIAEALAETTFVGGRRIESFADVYSLTEDDWAGLILGTTSTGGDRRLGTANARKIMANLSASKVQPFHRVITALGIRGTGRSMSRSLAAAFPTMDRLRAATVADLAEVEKIGPKKAALIAEGITRLSETIDRLAAAGVNMGVEPTAEEQAAAASLPLAGKTVVISGSVPGYTRTTAQEAVVAAGGTASGSVSAKTSYLVTAETTTSKATKAASLGVPVIDPDQFEALLRGEIG